MSQDFMYSDGSNGGVDGDLIIQGGQPIMIDQAEELRQAIRSLLSTPLGSFMDEDEVGIDFSFLIGGFDQNQAEEAATNAIMQDPRIISVDSITSNYDIETATITYLISYTSTFGNDSIEMETKQNAIQY